MRQKAYREAFATVCTLHELSHTSQTSHSKWLAYMPELLQRLYNTSLCLFDCRLDEG